MTIEELYALDLGGHVEHKPYWDVFPKLVRVSTTEEEQVIPLSIRGTFTPVFETSNPDIATVDANGCIHCGLKPGAAMVMVWKSGAKDSLRHVQVEVYGAAVAEETEGDIGE